MAKPRLISRVALSTAIIGTFLLLFFILVFTYAMPASTPEFLKGFVQYHFEFMLFMVGLGVAAGAAIFYLMHEEVGEKQKESQINAELVLSLLRPDEKKAIAMLLEKGGECLQADVARAEGMTRLKAHRTAAALEKRGIVALERRGKVVVLKLAENVRQALGK